LLKEVANGLDEVLSDFRDLFQVHTYQLYPRALGYIQGLFKSEKNRANCTSIADTLQHTGHQNIQHLLGDSPWDYRAVLTGLSHKARDLFGAADQVALLIDEVGFRKKGKYSACVGKQYLGCIGKHDNGQVAVVSALSSAQHYCPIDAELFMPKKWEDDTQRRKMTKIPDQIVHRTKTDIALEMINRVEENRVHFDYVCFDALYGSRISLLEELNQRNINFIGDVRRIQTVHLAKPEFIIPKDGKGPKFRFYHVVDQPIKLCDYLETLTHQDWKLIAFRNGTKQKIKAYFHRKRIWIVTDEQHAQTMELTLLIRKDLNGNIKYSLTNMNQDSMVVLAQKQGQRAFVEKVFEEGKNQLGMGDYQVRSWPGFHKHITLCFLGFYYLTFQKIKYEAQIPLTSPIIRKLVAATIFSAWQSLERTIELSLRNLEQYQYQKNYVLRQSSG